MVGLEKVEDSTKYKTKVLFNFPEQVGEICNEVVRILYQLNLGLKVVDSSQIGITVTHGSLIC